MKKKGLLLQKGLLFLFLFLFILNSPALCAVLADNSTGKTNDVSIPTFERHYDLSFLWFDNLASGELSLSPDPLSPNQYRAFLQGKTLGVAAWLTGDRVQSYETLMSVSPLGRLNPLEYRSIIDKKKGSEEISQTKLFTFNPFKRVISMTRTKKGKQDKSSLFKCNNPCFPVDFLTAGFNFIFEFDGPITPGTYHEIVTFTDDKEETIFIEVLRQKDWPKSDFFKKEKGTMLKVTLPKEILDTGGGSVYALLDTENLPKKVIIENVLGLGDVRGVLRP